MQKEPMPYEVEGAVCQGEIYYNSVDQNPRPGIIVAHAWRGLDLFARQKAQALADLGYVALAADLYGNGQRANSNEKALQLMLPLFLNRKRLRQRLIKAHETLCLHPLVDKSRIGAIGFCFGGLAVIELLRAGCEVKSLVTFHAILGDSIADQKAQLEPSAPTKEASMLILHGADDPLVQAADIINIQKELTAAGVDWQFNIYGHASHAFTNPEAHEPGLQFNPKASNRSWTAMKNFFKETLQ